MIIWTVLEPLVLPPLTEGLWLRVAAEYEELWNIMHCIGATDGRHIEIKVKLFVYIYHFVFMCLFNLTL